MREIDRITIERYGTPAADLMEHAAQAIAAAVWAHAGSANNSILILCGPGNNGGDGAAAARILAGTGARVDVVLFGRVENTKGDARANFSRLLEPHDGAAVRFFECESSERWGSLEKNELSGTYETLVDALFGTGLTRPLEGVFSEALNYLGKAREAEVRPVVISIDVPSGLNADLAQLIGPVVHADITVTMTAPKPANVLPPAAGYNGELIVADIGSPDELVQRAETQLFIIEESDARRWLIQTRYLPDSYKNTHGHVLVIAGSRGFTGAAALCANAAMRSGAGLVTLGSPVSAVALVTAQAMPEIMTAALAETDRGAVSDEALGHVSKLAERASVIAVGPGLSSADERTRVFVKSLIEQRKTPVVIDADGLNCLAPWPAELRGSADLPVVLTPHQGEMRRLIGTDDKTVLDDRVAAVREFATAHDVIVVLKGERSLIAVPNGRVFVNPTGNAGLGTAGAGDTLTGVIAGFLAQAYGTLKHQASATEAVVAALYVSGLAGDLAAEDLGMRAMVASDIRDHITAAICLLDPEGELP
ncbi:MAG: ADP-dependent NAD(P)H-hydrate dehydratase / NAD(P)H-hydrate epimerase [Blastocatellia bacterium]|nr:ADP-dependent NAD(P)H-hydrate dehydratase / NAD(P)H-hydrate epimerase [Blastocatellia bacterium]